MTICLHYRRSTEACLQWRQVQRVSAIPDLASHLASSEVLPGSAFLPPAVKMQVSADAKLSLGASLGLTTALLAT